MRMMHFAARNIKEITRDPLSILFGLGFPVVMIVIIGLMKQNITGMPQNVFPLNAFIPGMAVFGFSFISLFLGMLMANDRNGAFLTRLFTTPLKGADYIFGYSLPMIPIAVVQSLCCFVTALFFGFTLSYKILLALLVLLPSAGLFISFGLLLGSVFSASQVGGVSSILINVAAWLSGTWFNLDLIGGAFTKICNLLPFVHTIDSVAAVFNGDYAAIPFHLAWVLGYTAIVCFFAIRLFRKRMME